MNRRQFLKRLAACGLVAASPKLIFDVGKNARKIVAGYDPAFYDRDVTVCRQVHAMGIEPYSEPLRYDLSYKDLPRGNILPDGTLELFSCP